MNNNYDFYACLIIISILIWVYLNLKVLKDTNSFEDYDDLQATVQKFEVNNI